MNKECAKQLATKNNFALNCSDIFRGLDKLGKGIKGTQSEDREQIRTYYSREITLLEIVNNIAKIGKESALQFNTAIETKKSFYTTLNEIIGVLNYYFF